MMNDAWLAKVAEDSPADCALKTGGNLDVSLIEHRRTESSSVVWRIAVIQVSMCALADFSIGPIFSLLQQRGGPPGILAVFYFGLIGCTLAQGNLLAAWLVWSERPLWRRLAWHWVAAATLYCAWAVGVLRSFSAKDAEMACKTIGLVVPLVSLAAQFPLWVTRQWFGWRITRAASQEEVRHEQPLTIRGLMGAMVIVAVAATLARLVPVPQAQRGKEFWAAYIVGFLLASGISTIGMLPAGRMLLGMQRFRAALAWSGAYAAALISLIWIVRELMMRFALNGGPPFLGCAMLSSLMLGYAATLVVAGSVARAFGYRLVLGRRRLAS